MTKIDTSKVQKIEQTWKFMGRKIRHFKSSEINGIILKFGNQNKIQNLTSFLFNSWSLALRNFHAHWFVSRYNRAVRIGILYLLSGFGGSILSSLFIQNNISVGASGALFGLLGAMLSELLTNWTIYTDKVSWRHKRCVGDCLIWT